MGDKEITTKQLYDLIQGLLESNREIKDQIALSKEEIKGEITTVREDLSKELHQIRLENEVLKQENKTLKEKLEKIEKTTKKYNLMVYNLEEKEDKLNDLQNFVKVLNDHGKISCRFHDFTNFYRLGKVKNNKTRPISIELSNYLLREEILKNAKKLKDQQIFISVDYTQKEYQNRKLLRKYLQIARNDNKTAEIKNYFLFVDGRKFTLEDLRKKEIEDRK